MNKLSRLETKVGLFVFIGLVLLGLLLLQFSKGMSVFRPTYKLRLISENVGGLKLRSPVLMSGVQVGSVSDIQLAGDGKSVTIFLTIYKSFSIRDSARFVIEQQGFLGDQYVAVIPQAGGTLLTNYAQVTCEEPLNIQEVARSAAGFVLHVDEAARKLNDTISDVRRLVLNHETLTNLSSMVITLRTASDSALDTLGRVNALFVTNGVAISTSASNLVVFSEGLNRFGDSLNSVLATNSDNIASAVKNIEDSTIILKQIMKDVDAGKGPVGSLLRDEKVAGDLADILNNLSVTTSNLNRLGLWRGVLFPKHPKPASPPGQAVQSPREKSQ